MDRETDLDEYGADSAFEPAAPLDFLRGINMLRAMVFIDFENFNIALVEYYRKLNSSSSSITPRLDYKQLPCNIVQMLKNEHCLCKTFLFAPKPDLFLMENPNKRSTYEWLQGMKNYDNYDVIEGAHVSRPIGDNPPSTKKINDQNTYYVEEKGTDINLATHVVSKGLLNAYDTAVIVSGDSDYLPVMSILNTIGKNVVVVGVYGQPLTRFKQVTDQQITLKDNFFQDCLRL